MLSLPRTGGNIAIIFLGLATLATVILGIQSSLLQSDYSLQRAATSGAFVDQGGFAIDAPPSVAILFQVHRNIATSNVWERWFRDAYDWIRSERLEGRLRGPPMDHSNVLRAFVNYSPAFREDRVKEYMPPILQSRLIPAPVDCSKGHIAPCHYRLLLQAYTSMPDANYFILVSEDSVPLLSFPDLYNALKGDRRIRTSVFHLQHAQALPKSTPWKGEPREIIWLRLSDLSWLNDTRVESKGNGQCSSDECLSWSPIVNRYGDETSDKFYPSACLDSLSCFMVDCWGDMKLCADSGDLVAKWPYKWEHLKEDFLLTLLNNPNMWMLRRVEDNTTVGEQRVRLEEYLAEHFQSKYKGRTLKLAAALKRPLPDTRDANSLHEIIKVYKSNEVEGVQESLIS